MTISSQPLRLFRRAFQIAATDTHAVPNAMCSRTSILKKIIPRETILKTSIPKAIVVHQFA